MKKNIKFAIGTVITVMLCLVPLLHTSHAAVELSASKKLKLNTQPLDIANSEDGRQLYILSKGEILVYSLAEDIITDKIQVDEAYDRISSLPNAGTLILNSSTSTKIEIIQLEFIKNINIADHPVKGPVNAPVTIAVFSDYQ